ncbi:MAG: patatin-like phospholipase family protein [Alphaproteobacteria bacterium]|nr:patatin-like phospholipase family protein [Alphaproteobacteria bacterium]
MGRKQSRGLSRNPVPPEQITKAEVKDFPDVRLWEVDYKPDVHIKADEPSDCNILALSGGGSNGAFGAGFLNGWTKSGTRPDFKIVTGISTGGLLAPAAFLGPDTDEIIKNVFTTVGVKNIFKVKGPLGLGILSLLLGESYASTKPLRDLIAKLVDQEILRAVADEHAKGKRLYIGTTNLDAQRFIIWDMGAIASSGQLGALKLFRKVMLASASIPGVFPPVYFDVEVDGRKYDEMHVDGSVITGVFGYGLSLFTDETNVSGQNFNCKFYIIRNGKLAPETLQIPRRVLQIVNRSFQTMMKSNSWSDLIRLYSITKKDEVDFNYVSVPDKYEPLSKKMFDQPEMNRLFDLGFEMAESGYEWNKVPPGLESRENKEWIWTPER